MILRRKTTDGSGDGDGACTVQTNDEQRGEISQIWVGQVDAYTVIIVRGLPGVVTLASVIARQDRR
jgi:hypothetical protein